MEIRTEFGVQSGVQARQAVPVDNIIIETSPAAIEGDAQTPSSLPAEQQLADIIKLLGFAASKENVGLATTLIQNGLPVTEDSMRQLNRGLKLTGDNNKAVFLLQNNLAVNTKNANTLDDVVTGRFTLLHELADIAVDVDALSAGPMKETLSDLLAGGQVIQNQIFEAPKDTDKTIAFRQTVTPPAEAPAAKNQPVISLPEGNRVILPIDKGEADLRPEPLVVRQSTGDVPQAATEHAEAPFQPSGNVSTPVHPETPAVANGGVLRPDSADMDPSVQIEPTRAAATATGSSQGLSTFPEELDQHGQTEEPHHTTKSTVIDQQSGNSPKSIIRETVGPNEPNKAVPKSALYVKMLAKYAVDPETDSKEDIDRRLNLLKEAIAGAKRFLALNQNEPLYQKLERTERSLDFLNDTQKLIYLQIPVVTQGREHNAGLYVFRDKGRKSEKNGQVQSALLALDMAYLGHFEAYVQRAGRSVTCRFKISDSTRELLTATIGQLQSRLQSKGFSLDGCSFAKEGEPFTLLDSEPVDKGSISQDEGLVFLNIKV